MDYNRGQLEFNDDRGDQVSSPAGYDRQDAESTRSIHIRLKPGDYRELVRRARMAGVRPWDLVITWVEERLRRPEVASEIEELKNLVMEYREAADKAFIRMERLERAAGDIFGILGSGSERRDVRGAQIRARTDGRTKRRAIPIGAGRTKLSLHHEISAVLRKARGPMSASDIAREVEARGLYQGRGGPMTSTIVNSRVSHPMYRHLFVRSGGGIFVADPSAQSDD